MITSYLVARYSDDGRFASKSALLSLCYSSLLLIFAQDRTIRLWNPVKQNYISSYSGHGYEVRDASIEAENGKYVGSA